MARLPTTTDVFNAIAEPQRREIVNLLANGECSVNQIVEALGMKQPQVSKHLHVLKEVGLVEVRVAGQQRLYRLNGQNLKPVHDWIQPFAHLWAERLDRLGDYLEEMKKQERNDE